MKFPQHSEKFSEDGYSDLVNSLNVFVTNINFQDNFNGEIIRNIKIPAGVTATIPHALKRVPLFRVILRQSGNAVITDEGRWSGQAIQLKNNNDPDGQEAILTVMVI